MQGILQNIVEFIDKNTWVYYIPTILFAVMILFSILLGMKRGFRKSSHKLFIMLICLGTSIAAFYLLTANFGSYLYESVEKFTNGTGFTNLIDLINSQIDPQNAYNLGNSIPYPNMYGVMVTIVSNLTAVKFNGFENIAIEIYPYIDVFAQVIFKFAIFIACFVVFILLSIIFNFFDWIFFRKGKRKKKLKKLKLKYKNRSVLGGVVGCVHGLVMNLILFSFIGFTFYVIGASTPSDGRKLSNGDVTFKDDSIASIYDIAIFTDKLGNTGIFELLNKVQDKNNVPMYLFFANEIFSGHVVEEIKPVLDANGNQVVINGKPQYQIIAGDKVLIGDQFRSFTGLARDLLDCLVKHGGEELLIFGDPNTSGNANMDKIVNLFNNEAFNQDIELIIDKYQSTEYLKNMTKATIGFVSTNFEAVMKLAMPNNAEKYVSIFDTIFGTNEDRLNNSDDYIKVEDIVTFDDAKTLMKGVINTVPAIYDLANFMTESQNGTITDPMAFQLNVMNGALGVFEDLTPYLEELSMFKETPNDTQTEQVAKIDKMNKLYDRMVGYVFSTMTDSSGTPLGNPYEGKNVKWNREFFNLSSSISNICAINNELINSYDGKMPMLQVINDVFSKNYQNKQVIDTNYDELIDKAGKFESVSILLESPIFYSLYENILSKVCMKPVTIPHDIKWGNEGETKGELYKSLKVLREILAEETLKPYFADPKLENLNTVKDILIKLDSPYQNGTLLDLMFESKVLYYSTNTIISNLKVEPFEFVIPNTSKELVSGVEMTKKEDLVTAIKVLPGILKQVEDLNVVKTDPFVLTDVLAKVEVKNQIIGSDIITASMSKTIFNLASTNEQMSQFLIMPSHLDLTNDVDQVNLQKWMGIDGEFDKLLTAFTMIDIKAIANQDKAAIVNILKFEEPQFNKLIGSDLLYYSINNMITTLENPNFKIVVPTCVYDTNNPDKVVDRSELYKMVHGASKILDADKATNEFVFTFNNVITFKDEVLASNILYASLANKIIEIHNTQTTKNLYLPSTFVSADLNDITNSSWRQYKELESLLETFAVLGINLDEIVKGGFNPSDLTKQLLTLDEIYKDNRTKVEVLYDSSIIALTLSETLKNQESLKGMIFIPDVVNVPLKSSTEEIITPTEWVKLISGVKKAFGLNANDDLISQFTNFSALISNFFNPLTYEEGKMALFESYILEDTLVHQLLDALTNKTNGAVVVPTMLSLDNNKMWYNDRSNPANQGELCHMLDVLHITGVGKMFSDPNFSQVLEKALELSGIIYTEADALADGAGNTILLEKQTKQAQLLRSQVICATIIDKLSTVEFINVPKAYKFTNIKDEYNLDNIWYTSKELVNMFNSINELKLPISGTQIKFDVNTMLSNNYSLVNICKSKVMHTTLSNKLVNTTYKTLVIPYKLYNIDSKTGERVLDASEIDLLINSFKELGLSSFGTELSVPQASQVIKACESSIIRATLSNKILMALKQARFLEDPTRPLESFTRVTTGLVESLEQYSVFNKEDIREFVEVLNSNTQSSNGFEFKITSIDDIEHLNSSVFNSRIAMSVINDYILSNQTITQSFVILMIKKTNNPQYTISNHLVSVVVEKGHTTITTPYITKEELLTFKNTPVNPNAPVIPNVPEIPNIPNLPVI